MSGFVFGSLVVLSHQEALEQMRVYSQRLLHLEERSSRSFSCSIRFHAPRSWCFVSPGGVGGDGRSHLAPLEPEESSFFSFGFSGLYLCSLRSFIFEDFSFA